MVDWTTKLKYKLKDTFIEPTLQEKKERRIYELAYSREEQKIRRKKLEEKAREKLERKYGIIKKKKTSKPKHKTKRKKEKKPKKKRHKRRKDFNVDDWNKHINRIF